MKTITKLTTLLVVLLITTSCFMDGIMGIKGNRNVTTETRNISSDFEKIDIQQGINLYLTQGNSTSLKVEADENIMDLLKTEVQNNQLKIYFKKNVYKAKARNVYLTTNEISSIEASSGSSVKTENTWQIPTLEINTSSGSSVKFHVNADDISSTSSSGSTIRLYGKTNNFSAEASSGSNINATKLISTYAIAKASSGANITVNVNEKLTANASSGGSVNYEGNPTEINKDTSSGGNVTES
jgi:predicted methyltransferase